MGYKEKDKETYDDSFHAFDESLKYANDREVDFVLLGGDLFHEHRPSANAYFKCSNIFNEHVFGNKPRSVKFTTANYDK